ncbi:MAG: hypothetical protein ACJ8FY_19600 [Gemmataceae bacterium]
MIEKALQLGKHHDSIQILAFSWLRTGLPNTTSRMKGEFLCMDEAKKIDSHTIAVM